MQRVRGIGPFIIIQSSDGTTWLYGDLSPFTGLAVGDTVLQGQQISTEGNPARYSVQLVITFILNWKCYNLGQSFRYGYINSSNPCVPTGLPNQTGGPYIYSGTPVPPPPPPPPSINSDKKWLYYKTRKANIIL